MRKYSWFMVIVICMLFGCSSVGTFPHITGTQVNLSKDNYKILKTNIIGASSGFSLFGLIPIVPPKYTVAMSRLYKKAGMREGASQALTNVSQEHTALYLILFAIPTLTVRADIVEFQATSKENNQGAVSGQGLDNSNGDDKGDGS